MRPTSCHATGLVLPRWLRGTVLYCIRTVLFCSFVLRRAFAGNSCHVQRLLVWRRPWLLHRNAATLPTVELCMATEQTMEQRDRDGHQRRHRSHAQPPVRSHVARAVG